MKTATDHNPLLHSWRQGLALTLVAATLAASTQTADAAGVGRATPRYAQPAEASVQEQTDACMTMEMERQGIPGAAMAVVVDGEIVYEQGYGVKHLATGEPVDPETRFRFGSVGKMMTAAGLMRQVDRGAVDLDDPVIEWIPELDFDRFRTDAMTVRHLLTHTSGISRDLSTTACGTDEDNLAAWAAGLGGFELRYPAGAFHVYSNAGYNLAGLVAERASGVPYHRYMKEQVWQPAGMLSTTPFSEDVLASGNYTFGHAIDPETGELVFVTPDSGDCRWNSPSGDSFSTVGDMARFAVLMMEGGGALLSEASTAELQSPQVWTHGVPDAFYGLGVSVEQFGDLEIRHHNGRNDGWSSYLLWVPEEKFAVAVLANGGEPPARTAYCALQTVLDVEPEEPVDYSTHPSTWGEYRGLYTLRDGAGEVILAYVAPGRDRLYVALAARDNPLDFEIVEGRQLGGNTFFLDLDRDGAPNANEVITFARPLTSRRKRALWVLNRTVIGPRVWSDRRFAATKQLRAVQRLAQPMRTAAEELASIDEISD